MSKAEANLREGRRLPTGTARSSATCCTAIATSSKASTRSSPMRRFVSMSMPSVFYSCSFLDFAENRFAVREVKKSIRPRRSDVYTPKSGYCTVHDDYERHLLGLVGQYVQGCQELSF